MPGNACSPAHKLELATADPARIARRIVPGRDTAPSHIAANRLAGTWHASCHDTTQTQQRSGAMSLFGAMNTAISGLNAQSNAFGNISDNVANAQTVGYKRVDTNFIDYLTTSDATNNDPGSAVARPDYVNDVQGTISQSDNPLSLAITGQGFFAVSHKVGENNGVPTFDTQKYYTRAGDFQLDKNGYLVNSANEALNGWPVASDGTVNQNTLAPIQVTQTVYNPVPTSTVTLSANLPATPSVDTSTTPLSSDLAVC
jgi:flagellar hook protein FlgE